MLCTVKGKKVVFEGLEEEGENTCTLERSGELEVMTAKVSLSGCGIMLQIG